MRKYLRKVYLSVFGFFKEPSNSVHILNSHFVSEGRSDSIIFERLLSKLSKKAKFINVDEALSLISSMKKIDKPYISFTYDDGFEECYTKIAPELEKYGVRGTFFINPGFINGNAAYCANFTQNTVRTPRKNSMTWEQVIELDSRGHTIGCHTYDHIRLNTTDEQVIKSQLLRSKREIERRLNKPCKYLAYPYGQASDLSEVALDIALNYYTHVFSGCNFINYYSFDRRVVNRRHIEGNWPLQHVNYFLSHLRTFD
jgi:peptidoglycan/xylan/chitin deacetylase (PgdA/CDA1 family)